MIINSNLTMAYHIKQSHHRKYTAVLPMLATIQVSVVNTSSTQQVDLSIDNKRLFLFFIHVLGPNLRKQ